MAWFDKLLPASIADLKALEKRMNLNVQEAIARLNKSVSDELKAISDKLSQPDTDSVAIAAQLNTVADKLDAETATLIGPPTPTV